jgi:hypothetical protein
MEASQNKSDVIIQFLVGDLVITLPEFSIYLLPLKIIQEFYICIMVKNFFFQFWVANMTPKSFFANLDTAKRHYREKIWFD